MRFGELHIKNARFIPYDRFKTVYLAYWQQPALDPCSGDCKSLHNCVIDILVTLFIVHVQTKDENERPADYWCGCDPRKYASDKHKVPYLSQILI